MPALVIPRRAVFAVLIVLIVALVAVWLLARAPKATITVTPATHERAVSQEITLSSAATEPDFVRYVLPAKLVEKEVAEQKIIKREGANVRDDFAKGIVTLKNEQEDEQRLLPKSHLRHEASGVFFLTDTPVTIPPEGDVQVKVTAKEQGPKGNVAAGKWIVDKLPASVQAVVYGESSTTMSGGTSVDTPLSGDELNKAKEEVKQAATARAQAELATAAGGAVIRPDLITIETLEETASAEAGSNSTEFTVLTKVKARAFVVDDKDLLSLTLLALRSSTAADEEFAEYNPQSFKAEIIRSDFTRGEARVKGTVTGFFASKTGPTLFSADNLAGRSAAEAQEYFKQFPSVASVDVQLSPFWVKAIPSRPGATEIVVKSGEKK